MADKFLEGEVGVPQEGAPLLKVSVRDVFYVIFRHKKKILFGTMLAVAIVIAIVANAPRVYRSEAKLLVRFISDTVVMDPKASGQIMSGARNWENIFNSEVEILSSRALAEKTVDALGVGWFFPSETGDELEKRTRAVDSIVKRLRVWPQGRSNIIYISLDAEDPETARTVLDTLVKTYLQKHMNIHLASGSFEFLSEQTEQIRAKLAGTEGRLRALEVQAGIVSLAEQKRVASARLSELNGEIAYNEAAMAASRAKMEMIRNKLARSMAAGLYNEDGISTNAASGPIHERLHRLRMQELDFLSKYTENSIPMRDLRRQIAETMAMLGNAGAELEHMPIAENPPTFYDQLHVALLEEEAQMSAMVARQKVLKEQLAQLREETAQLSEVENEITPLQRELVVQEASFQKFATGLEQARVDHALAAGQVSNISEVQPATLPTEMVQAVKHKRLAFILFAGLFGSIGLAFFTEYCIDHSIKRPEDIEHRLKDEVLVSVPHVSGRNPFSLGGAYANRLLPATSNLVNEPARDRWDVHSDMREHYENLRDRILMEIRGYEEASPYLLGVTSCYSGEGVSTVAASLALTLAQADEGRVLLVDMSIQRSEARRIFGEQSRSPGMIDLHGDGQGNVVIIQPNLYVLTATNMDGDAASSVTAAQKLEDLIRGFRNSSQYGFVVFDMPPVIEAASASRVSSLLNGVVLVVEAEQVRREVVEKARRMLLRSRANLLGMVLNKRRYHLPEWLYKAV